MSSTSLHINQYPSIDSIPTNTWLTININTSATWVTTMYSWIFHARSLCQSQIESISMPDYFSYLPSFSILFWLSYAFFLPLIYLHFTVAPLLVFKHRYKLYTTLLNCEGQLLLTQIRTKDHLVLTKRSTYVACIWSAGQILSVWKCDELCPLTSHHGITVPCFRSGGYVRYVKNFTANTPSF